MNEHHHISHIRRSQPLIALIQRLITLFGHIPDSLIAAVGRFSNMLFFFRFVSFKRTTSVSFKF